MNPVMEFERHRNNCLECEAFDNGFRADMCDKGRVLRDIAIRSLFLPTNPDRAQGR